jgi:WD40 repeat protein
MIKSESDPHDRHDEQKLVVENVFNFDHIYGTSDIKDGDCNDSDHASKGGDGVAALQRIARQISSSITFLSRKDSDDAVVNKGTKTKQDNPMVVDRDVWDTTRNERCPTRQYSCYNILLGSPDVITGMTQYSENTLLSTSIDNKIRMWNILTGQIIKEWKGHEDKIYALLSLNDNTIVTGGLDRSIRHWNALTGECLRTIERAHLGGVRRLALLNDGRIASSSTGEVDKNIKIWSLESGKCEMVLVGHTGAIWALIQLRHSGFIVSGSDDDTVRIWNHIPVPHHAPDDDHGGASSILSGESPKKPRSKKSDLMSMARQLAHSIEEVATDILAPSNVPYVNSSGIGSIKVLGGHDDHVSALCETHDGCLCSGALNGSILLWDVSDDICIDDGKDLYICELEGHVHAVLSLCALDDPLVNLASGSAGGHIRLWNTRLRICTQVLRMHTGAVGRLLLLEDGTTIASGAGDGLICLWSRETPSSWNEN